MTVSVVEVATGSLVSATTHTVDLATTPSAGDVLVVVNFRVLDSTTSCSGCGATWSQALTVTGAAEEFDVFVGTGANASGTITVTQGTSRTGFARAFLVRGLTSTDVVAAHDTTGTATAQTITITSDTAHADDFVLGMQISDRAAVSGSTTFSATTPASGWTIQTPVGSGQPTGNTGYYLPTGDETVDHSFTVTGSGRAYGLGTVIIGPSTASTSVTVDGETAGITLAAPAGTVSAIRTIAVAGAAAAVTLAALAGTVSVSTPASVSGETATITTAAPAGTVTATSNATIAGPNVDLTIAAPDGVVTTAGDATVAGEATDLAIAAPAGTVTVTASTTIAGVTATVTIAAPAGTVASPSVTLAGPATGYTLAAPAGTVKALGTAELPDTIPDPPAVWLYDPTGRSLLGQITTAVGIAWTEELNAADVVSFSVPLTDTLAASIVNRSVVKVSYQGAIVSGCQVRTEECELAVDGDGNRLIVFNNQPGLLSMLNAGTVLPEWGLTRAVGGSDRRFGFMSNQAKDGHWYLVDDWVAPQGYNFADDTTGRKGKPADFAPYNPMWIAKTDPSVSVPNGTVQYIRTFFDNAVDKFIEIVVAADDYLTLYLNGQLIVSPDYQTGQSWRTATHVQIHTPKGLQVLAAKIENAPLVSGHTNPVGFILTMLNLDADGNPTADIYNSDLTHWLAYNGTGDPGYHRGQVLWKAIEDMRVFGGVTDVTTFTATFSMSADSNGDDWGDDASSDWSFPIGSTGLCDLALQLTASGPLDVWVDPATMELNAVNRLDGTSRKGADKTGTVEFQLGGDGGNLISYKTTKTTNRFTSVIAQLADGSWELIEDDAGITDAGGRLFTGMQLGTTTSLATAEDQVAQALAETAEPVISIEAEVAAYGDGPMLYDLDLGDSVTVPGHRGDGTISARLMGRTVDATGDVIKTTALLVQDLSL